MINNFIARWVTLFLVMILVCAPAQAQTDDTSALSPEDRVALEQVIKRGEEIYYRDAAAWVVTDALLEKVPVAKLQALGIIGWVTMPLAPDQSDSALVLYQVSFLTENDGEFRKLYVANVLGWDVVDENLFIDPETRPRLSAEEIQAFRAKKSASASMTAEHWCSGPFNTVVIPTETGHDVYLLSPETETGQVQIGGHYKVVVSENGSVGEMTPFTNSCLSSMIPSPEEGELEAIIVSHLLGPLPNETHVFKSLSHRLPIYVLTMSNDQLWNVEGSRIGTIDPDEVLSGEQ